LETLNEFDKKREEQQKFDNSQIKSRIQVYSKLIGSDFFPAKTDKFDTQKLIGFANQLISEYSNMGDDNDKTQDELQILFSYSLANCLRRSALGDNLKQSVSLIFDAYKDVFNKNKV
jgi:hypothetical protein